MVYVAKYKIVGTIVYIDLQKLSWVFKMHIVLSFPRKVIGTEWGRWRKLSVAIEIVSSANCW